MSNKGRICKNCKTGYVSSHEATNSKSAVCGKCYLKQQQEKRKRLGLL